MDMPAFIVSLVLVIAKAVTSLLAGVVLLVEQWFSNTVLRTVCSSQASLVRLLAIFLKHIPFE